MNLTLNTEKFYIKPIEFYPEWIQLYPYKKFYKKYSEYNTIKSLYKLLGIDTHYNAYKVLLPTIDEKENQVTLQWFEINGVNGSYEDKTGKTIYKFKYINKLIVEQEKFLYKSPTANSKNFKRYFESILSKENFELAFKLNGAVHALPMQPISNILRLDIDNHNNSNIAQYTLRRVCEILNYPEMFIEQSIVNNGYHLYIPFKNGFTEQQKKLFIEKINSEIYESLEDDAFHKNTKFVECPTYLRLPNSPSYAILKIQSKEDLFQLISEGTCNSFLIEYMDMINYVEGLKQSENSCVLDYIEYEITEEQERKEEVIESFIIPFIRSNLSFKNIDEKYNNIHIGKSHRHKYYESKVAYGYLKNLAPEQVLKDIRIADAGSKDLAKTSDAKLLQDIIRLYNYFENKVQDNHFKKNVNQFQSNKNLVPQHIVNSCDKYIDHILYDSGYKSRNRRKKFHKQAKDLFLEIIGQFIYDTTINKKSILNNYIQSDCDSILSHFSNKWFILFKLYYNINNHSCDIKRIFKTIINDNSLFTNHLYTINNKKVSYLYKKYKACKGYTCLSIDSIYSFLLSIKNKFSYIKEKFKEEIFMILYNYYIYIDYYVKSISLNTLQNST